jgi:hypothetical protein
MADKVDNSPESSPAIEATSAQTKPARAKKAKKPRGAKSKKGSGKKQAPRIVVSAEQLPRKSLEQALPVARVLREVYAGGPATWDQIAKALKVPSTHPSYKYPLWAAVAYNIVQKDDDKFSLSELGRKILAPTTPNEDKEAIIQAVLTPTILSRFFTDYNNCPFPGDEHIGNVLEVKYGIPRERLEEAKVLFKENGLFSGMLQQQPDGSMMVRLDAGCAPVPKPSGSPTEEPGISDLRPVHEQQTRDFSRMCFVITPIGDDDSEARRHANMVLKSIVEPVASELDMFALRADQIDRAGIITQQTFECLAKARVCVADLSFNNPNAFYELGVRHMCKLPTVQIIRKGDRIPFDVSQGRTIKIDMADVYSVIESVESAKKELKQHLKHAISAEYKGEDNPVNTYLPGAQVTLPK